MNVIHGDVFLQHGLGVHLHTDDPLGCVWRGFCGIVDASTAIQQIFKGSLKQIKQGIAVAQISHASLTARECKGLNSAEIQKRLGIKEGGLNTLFVTQAEGEFICWVCTNHLPDQLNS